MTASARLIWIWLQSRESAGVAGQAKIAQAVGLSRETVRKALAALTEAGIIQRHRRGLVGGGRRGDFIHMRQTSSFVGEARQGRFFSASRPRPARSSGTAWMSMVREFVEPWQRQKSRKLVADRRMVGQWATVCSRESDPAVRAAMVARYLSARDPYLVQKDHPLGLMLVRWMELHHQAQADVRREAERLARIAAGAVDEVLPSTGTIDADRVARFRQRAAR